MAGRRRAGGERRNHRPEVLDVDALPSALVTLLGLMEQRRSVRRFLPEPPPQALLDAVLGAAALAPSAGGRQAWRLHTLQGAAAIEPLAVAVTRRCEALLDSARPDSAAGLRDYLRQFSIFAAAPVVVAASYRLGRDLLAAATGPGGRADEPEGAPPRATVDALSSVSAALMQVLLAAEAAGLGACWMTGPLVAQAELERLLALPRGWRLAALVPLGWPAERPAPPRRRGLGVARPAGAS